MRTSCLECVLKHLAQAEVLFEEALQGYELHRILAWGHMAEASAECLEKYPALANEIRDHRKLSVVDANYQVPTFKLFEKVLNLLTEEDEPGCAYCAHTMRRHSAIGCIDCGKHPRACKAFRLKLKKGVGFCAHCTHAYEEHYKETGCYKCQCLKYQNSETVSSEEAKKVIEEISSDLPF